MALRELDHTIVNKAVTYKSGGLKELGEAIHKGNLSMTLFFKAAFSRLSLIPSDSILYLGLLGINIITLTPNTNRELTLY